MLRTLFVSGIITAGLVASLFDRFAALLLYLWFALFRPIEWVWIDLTSLRLSLIVGLLLVIPSMLSGILPDITHPLSVGTLVFLGACLVAGLNAVDPVMSLQWIDYTARLLVVCLLAVTLVSTRRRFLLTVVVVSASYGFHAAKAGLASLIGGGIRFEDGLAGAFIDNNGYALGAAMILPLLIATSQNLPSRVLRWGFLITVPLSAMLVVSTFSRGGLLALAAATLAILILHRRKLRAGLTVLVLVGAALTVVPMPAGYFGRIETIQTYQEVGEESAISRPHFWRVAVEMAQDRPLGVGLRNFEAAYDQYDFLDGRYGRRRSVHSSHFQVLAETGFIGAISYSTLFVYAFVISFRIRSRSKRLELDPEDSWFLLTMANALIASMTAFLVGGSFIALALNDLTWLTFALIAALDRLSIAILAERAGDAPAVAPVRMDRLPRFGTVGARPLASTHALR